MGTAAKRGDLIVIEEIRTYTFVHGSRPGGTNKIYVLGVVSSVTRDGLVKAADRIGPASGERFAGWWHKKRGSFRHGIFVAAADRLTSNPVDIIQSLGIDEFESVEAARDALLQYRKAA